MNGHIILVISNRWNYDIVLLYTKSYPQKLFSCYNNYFFDVWKEGFASHETEVEGCGGNRRTRGTMIMVIVDEEELAAG